MPVDVDGVSYLTDTDIKMIEVLRERKVDKGLHDDLLRRFGIDGEMHQSELAMAKAQKDCDGNCGECEMCSSYLNAPLLESVLAVIKEYEFLTIPF
jgi:hypothetical protein